MSSLRVAGFNDEQTQCDRCGKLELRGTVILVDPDGVEVGRFGTTCAGREIGNGQRVTRSDALNLEAYRRQCVSHLLRQAMNADTHSRRAWWLGECVKFHTLHRVDEFRVFIQQLGQLPECWAVIVPISQLDDRKSS